MKLQTKFILLVTGALFAGACAAMVGIYRHHERELTRALLAEAAGLHAWVETAQDHFSARNDEGDSVDQVAAHADARKLIDEFSKRFPKYRLRQISDEPLNPANRPVPGEETLLAQIRRAPGRTDAGFVREAGIGEWLISAKPIVVEESCVRCHRNGADESVWRPGQVAGAATVWVPTKDIRLAQAAEKTRIFWGASSLSVCILGMVYAGCRLLIGRPLRRLGEQMVEIAERSAWEQELHEAKGKDELAAPAQSFNRVLAVVRENLKALKESNERLEQRVTERTAALERSNQELVTIREMAPDCIVSINLRGEIVVFNEAAEKTFGYRREDVIGKPMAALLIPPSQREAHAAGIGRFLAGDQSRVLGQRVEVTGMRSDRSEVLLEMAVTRMDSASGPILSAYMRDISVQRREQWLEADRRRVMEMMTENRPLPDVLGGLVDLIERQHPQLLASVMLLKDGRLRMIAAQGLRDGFCRQLDTMPRPPAPIEARDGDRSSVVDIHHEPAWSPLLEEAIRGGLRSCWSLPIMSNGEVLGALVIYARELAEPTEKEVGTVALTARVAAVALEQRRLLERLAHQARHDLLTGLPNRVLFEDRLNQAVSRSKRDKQPVALLLLDVDRFKIVNDTLGHQAGDQLLCQVAQRLTGCVRESDTVARIGGDEFAIVLAPLASPDDSIVVARKLIEVMKGAFPVSGRDVFVGASVGIALYPQDGADAVSLQKSADAALYLAKHSGRSQFRLFAPELNDAALERLEMETRLRAAVEARELRLHYQPKVDTMGQVVGVEALLRWTDPQWGPVSPAQFIPVAEESGLILPMGEWVLEEACRQAAAWQRAGLPPVHVAVNVSMVQFNHGNLVEQVAGALARNGLEPHWLEVEITESMLLSEPEKTAEKLASLRQLGVRVAIDDFGTGYSSLSYLHRLPIDTLKIDRSFVKEIGGETAVILAIISLAQSLGLRTVAEGVETVEQQAFLRDVGCDMMQGFLFGKPLSADEVAHVIAASRATMPGGVIARSA